MRQVWREQNWILLALMLILGFTPVFRNGYASQSLKYLFALGAVTGIIYIHRRREGFSLPLIYVPLVLFLTWNTLSFVWTANPHLTLSELWRLGLYMLVFILAASLNNGESHRLQNLVVTVGTAVAGVGILQYLFVDTGRITSTFINPNPLGIYLGMVTLLALHKLISEKGQEWKLSLVVAINASGMVLTGSRGSMLAFAAALAMGLAAVDRSHWRSILWGIGRAALLSAILIFLLVKAAPAPQLNDGTRTAGTIIQSIIINLNGQQLDQGERLQISRPLTSGDTSVLGRWSYWRVAGRMIRENPLTGVGLDSYQSAYFAYWDGDHEYSKYAHNHYLQTGAELGIPGMLFLVIFLIAFMINRWRARPRDETSGFYLGTWSAALAFLLHLVVDFTWNMPAVTITFWALMGIMAGPGQRDQLGNRSWKIPRSRGPAMLAIVLLVLVCGIQYSSFLLAQKGRLADIERRLAEARNYYMKATSLYPYRSLNYQWLARVEAELAGKSAKKSDLAGALAAAERAVEVDPYNQEVNELLGRLQWQAGDVEAAEASLSRAVNVGGFYPAPHAALGNFYISQERFPEAEEVFHQGLGLKDYALAKAESDEEKKRLNASVVDMRLGLARAFDERQDYRAASKELYKVLEIDANNPVALRVLASYRARKLG